MTAQLRVRFAPSPTGFLHVGSARTALFNWLFARHHGGAFILRIEDTDVARNRPEYLQAVYEGLRWLSLDWDEGPDRGGPYAPYLQSERNARHLAVARQLLVAGKAYECFCIVTPPDEDENDDESCAAPASDLCRCSSLPEWERQPRRAEVNPAIRLRVPTGRDFIVDDLIRGRVTFPGDTIRDFIIVTSDSRALYNLGAAVDDHDMRITHVIRGEEHLANTPKQMLLYEAMNWETPHFAHIPIILNAQRRKLSKRDGATSLHDYRAMGYVPDAVVNFLSLLGWSPKDNRELLSRADLVALFDLDGVVKHPAIFDTAKLSWMNKEYIRSMPVSELTSRVLELVRGSAVQPSLDGKTCFAPDYVERVASLLHDRVRTVVDVLELGSYFFRDGFVEPDQQAVAKYCATPQALTRLREVRNALAGSEQFDAAGVEGVVRDLAASHGVKASEYIHPLRVAVTGQAVSPGIFEVCAILGRPQVVLRIEALLAFLDGKIPDASAARA